MSSSTRSKTRNQVAEHFKNTNSELKRKTQSSSSGRVVASELNKCALRKDPVIIGEKQSAKNRGGKCSVSEEKARKGKTKDYSNVGNEKRVLRRKDQLDVNSTSDDDEIEFLGEKNVTNGSILSDMSEDEEDNDGIEFLGEKFVANSSSTSASSEDDEDEDVIEFLGEKMVKNGCSSKNVSDSRTPSVSNEVSRDENTDHVNFVGVKSTPPVDDFVENVCGDSDGSTDQSLDSNMYELESSGEEEEDMDDSDMECEEDELLSSDDSSDVHYSSSGNDVIGIGQEDNKENVVVEKTLTSWKKNKRVNQKKDFAVELNKDKESNEGCSRKCGLRHKKLLGLEVMVDFDDFSDEEHGNSKSQNKDHQVGIARLKPVIECEARKDNESNSSKWECSNEKKLSCKEEVAKIGKKTTRSARNAELIRILLNAVNEEKNVEESGLIHQPLQLKFRFEDDVADPPPEQTEWDEEIDSLFLELNYCLRISEIDSANLSKTESEDATTKVVNESPAASCGRGAHDPVLDEQIGSVCRFCGVILLEIKDILPPWYTPRSKRKERKYLGESPNPVNGEFQSYNSINGPNESMRVQGTVWDLIPGFEKDLFPHQREGFEFLWKNIAGDIEIEKLPKSLSDDGRGCIISHAPGTGKTRLAVVFLLSFLKRYPNAHPVIIAPQVILSTWEKEFVKWKVDIPFHNMNNSKLSGNETRFGGGTKVQGVRLARLLSWIGGGGILGISYTLFGTLASKSEKGGEEEAIWETLVNMPGLLVLDEGHTPRNGSSCIWKAIKKVTTKRCIILSGTPFQNNFEELKNTLGLVDPRLQKMGKSSWKELTEGKDELEELRSMLDPYVHLHKGSVLQQSLPGLKDAMIFLRPTELQKTLMDVSKKEEAFLALTYLVSLISVHPSVLMADEKTKFVKSRAFSLFKDKLEEIESDLDEGVKIKFVMNLIQLADALGERVLVFSHFRYPLMFIKKQLKTHFSWNEGREVLYMDGKLEEKQRQHAISSFNNSLSEAKVLLASQKVCSEGINLVGASRVVLLTTAWNPSVERQAISRAYRLGQKKVVYVYRLITSGMEVRQYELQARKDQISQLIFSPVDEQAGESETSCEISEDKILEQMQNLESFRNTFEKIVHQPKESDFLENFRFEDL